MLISKQKLLSLPSPQSGFTLIECLVAIIVVSVLLVAVAPALVVSTATRVQSRRVELATQAAQVYMDGLRAGKIPPPPYGFVMDPNSAQLPKTLNTFPPPQGTTNWTCQPTVPPGSPAGTPAVYCADGGGNPTLYCVDIDSKPNVGSTSCTDGDYVVQGFRSFYPDISDKGEQGYMLGIRVYRADGMKTNGSLKTTVNAQGKSRKLATHTGGAGDRTTPLVELTTQIRTDKTTYESLCDRLGGCGN